MNEQDQQIKKIKVAHVIRVFSYGGAEVLLRESFEHSFFKEQVASDLYILDHKKLGLVTDVLANVNAIHSYKISSLKFFFEWLKFLRHIIKNKYDVVHMHLPVAGWMTIPAKFFSSKTKFIYTEHNLVTFYSKLNYYLLGIAYRFFDCVIYVSQEVGDVIKKAHKSFLFKPKRSVTILNGVNTDKFSNTHRSNNINGNLTVGLVARFRRQKRVDRWVEVAAEITKINPQIKFLMVGDGPDENMLRQKIRSLKLEDKIEMPGMQKNTVEAFQHIDIFLLTSDFEGLPLALMEAMACGCVPVISNVGGIKQLELDGFGYKYDVFNAPEIAHQIANYATNQDQLKDESLRARKFVEKNYSLTNQVYKIVDLYKEITNF